MALLYIWNGKRWVARGVLKKKTSDGWQTLSNDAIKIWRGDAKGWVPLSDLRAAKQNKK